MHNSQVYGKLLLIHSGVFSMKLGAELDFTTVQTKLRLMLQGEGIKWARYKCPETLKKVSILSICLRNGCRSSEGIECFNLFCANHLREQQVRIRKAGCLFTKTKDNRRVRVNPGTPPENPRYVAAFIPGEVRENQAPYTGSHQNLNAFCKKWLDCRVHALRYCNITELAKEACL